MEKFYLNSLKISVKFLLFFDPQKKDNPNIELEQGDTHSGTFDPIIPKELPKIYPIKRLLPEDNSKENLIRDLKKLRLSDYKEEFNNFVKAIENSSENDVTEILKRLIKYH